MIAILFVVAIEEDSIAFLPQTVVELHLQEMTVMDDITEACSVHLEAGTSQEKQLQHYLPFTAFCVTIFFFHISSTVVLPLVMQNIAGNNDQKHGLLSASYCIIVSQIAMVITAKISRYESREAKRRA